VGGLIAAWLSRVRCPPLVLHSRDDARVPFEDGRLLATQIPGASLVTIDSRNHLLLEAGWATAGPHRTIPAQCRHGHRRRPAGRPDAAHA
jgi:pimeloyl-ACP methyl ester carboxylesterase